MKYNKIILIIGVIFLGNCGLPETKNELPLEHLGQGNFFIEYASGQIIATTTHEKIDLPKSRTISYRICIRDRRSRTPILNQNFEIYDESQNHVGISMTDHAGCLTWGEELYFSFFKQSHNLLISRKIRNRGRWSGDTTIRFVVNPWNSRIMSEIETNFKGEGLEPITLNELNEKPDSAVARVLPLRSLFTVNEIRGNQALFKFDFMGQLLIENKDHLNQVFQIQINRARFKSRMTLINLRKDGKQYLIYRSPWSDLQDLREAMINVETSYYSNTLACPNGRLLVGLELDISNTSFNLKPFDMLYKGPNCQATGFVLMVPDSQFVDSLNEKKILSLDDFIEKYVITNVHLNINDKGNVTYIRPLDFYPSEVTTQGFNRTRTVKVHTCLTSVVDYDQIRQENLEIISSNGKKQILVTDDEGCFSWNEDFHFNHFEGQCWKIAKTIIRSIKSDISFEIPIAYNSAGYQDEYRDLRYFKVSCHHVCPQNRKHHSCSSSRHSRQLNREPKPQPKPKPNFYDQNKSQNQHGVTGFIFKSFGLLRGLFGFLTPHLWAQNKSELYIHRIDLHKIGEYEYEVDPYLNVSLIKNFQITFEFLLRRISLLDPSGFSIENPPLGNYIVKIAVVEPQFYSDLRHQRPLDGSQVIFFKTFTVDVLSRFFVATEISFKIQNNLKLLGNTNEFFIRIEPNSRNAQAYLNPTTFAGGIILQKNSETITLRPFQDHNIFNKIEKAYQDYINPVLASLKQQHNKQKFAQAMHLSLFNLYENDNQKTLRERLTNPLYFQHIIPHVKYYGDFIPKKEHFAKFQYLNHPNDPQLIKYQSIMEANQANPLPELNLKKPFKNTFNPPLPVETIQSWIENPQNIRSFGAQLCSFWFGDYTYRNLPNKNYSIFNRNPYEIRERILLCRHLIKKKFQSVFDVELVNFVHNPKISNSCEIKAHTEPYPHLCKEESRGINIRGQFRDLTIGQNFSKNRSISKTITAMMNFNALSLSLPIIPKQMIFVGNQPGIAFSLSSSKADAQSDNMFESVTSGITIISEIFDVRIFSEKIERCITIRLNPSLFAEKKGYLWGTTSSRWKNFFHAKLTDQEKLFYLSSGLMICEGEHNAGPGYFIENYGVFNQKMPENSIALDPFSSRNRPFYMDVRGIKNYLKAVSFMVGNLKMPHGFEEDYARAGFRENDLKLLFFSGFPSYPGVTYAIPQKIPRFSSKRK